MNRKESISSSFFLNALFLIFITAGLTGYFWIISDEFKNFSSEIQELRNEYIQSQKHAVKCEVMKIIDFIDYRKESSSQDLREFLKEIVTNAYNTAENIYKENKSRHTDDEIKKMIKDALRKITFNNKVIYFFIDDAKSVSQLYPPDPSLEGKIPDAISSLDSKSAFRAQTETIRKDGEGYITYQWQRPGDKHNKNYSKISFVKYFTPYQWFIGAGEYPENINKKMQKCILSRISGTDFAKNGYISVENIHGTLIWSQEKEMIGKDISDIRDNKGIKVFEEKLRLAESPGGGFIQYMRRKQGTNEIVPQISFVKTVKDWEWILEGAVYMDDMENVISTKKEAIQKKILLHIIEIIATLFLVTLLASLIAAYTAGKIKASIKVFTDFFEKTSSHSVRISPENVNFSEFRKLAEAANEMTDKRNQIESKLRLYREIFMNTQEAVALIDLKGAYIECNRVHELMFGYTMDELIGKTPALFMGESNFQKVFKEIFERGKYSSELICVNKKGKMLHISLSVFTIRDEYGNPVCHAGIKRDITEKKENESKIKDLRQQIEFILGATKTGLDIIDANYNIIYVDSSWEKIYGPYGGKKCYEYFMDRSEHCPGCGISKAFETGKPIITNEILVKEGNRPIQVTTYPFQNAKGEWLVAEINVDITEQIKIQNELRDYITFQSILSSVRAPSYEVSEAELFRLFLENIVENYDFRMAWYGHFSNNQIKPEFYAGYADRHLDGMVLDISTEKTHCINSAMSKAVLTKKPFGYEDLASDEDFKTWRDYALDLGYSSILALPLILNNKIEGGIMCYSSHRKAFSPEKIECLNKLVREFAVTLSERRKYADAQLTVRKTRDASDAANKSRNEFLFYLRREITTSISGIASTTELLLKSNTGDKERKLLNTITCSSELIMNMMNNFRDFSRIETEKIGISPLPFELRKTIEKITKTVSFKLKEKELALETAFSDGIPLYVSADAERLRQVLLNLLDNSIKFSKKGRIKISVSALKKLDAKSFLSFSIEDNGIGISPEHLKYIFSPDFREWTSGTGLLISKKIIEAMNGSINVSSTPGKGSVFQFEIMAEFLEKMPPDNIVGNSSSPS
ncbi:MAG: hypothetical protein A2017_11745 [Lentisphaerae bacterium GWF2_44_16]|nr:MAG: hypothetical protein A2017_11745 [Lentisphaerae bacterium GWF2_44_16]